MISCLRFLFKFSRDFVSAFKQKLSLQVAKLAEGIILFCTAATRSAAATVVPFENFRSWVEGNKIT